MSVHPQSASSTALDRLILAVSFWPTGAVGSGWRSRYATNDGIFDAKLLADVARTAERGIFDYFFMGNSYSSLADQPGSVVRRAFQLDGFAAASYLSAITQHIGLISTINSTLLEPYSVAQHAASIDHLSGGRFGLNLVTGASNDPSYENFSMTEHPDSQVRYSRATEFTIALNALQQSWERDWYLNDGASGRLFNPESAHPINFVGEHFKIQGPLNAPPSPQGRVPLIHAGTSEASLEYGARYAEIRFSPYVSKEWNIAYRNDQQRRAAAAGRTDGGPRIVVGAVIYPGATLAEARALHNEVESQVVEEFGPSLIARTFGVDPSRIDPHRRVLDVLQPEVTSTQGEIGVNTSMAIGSTNMVISLENAFDAFGSEDITFLDLFRFLTNRNHFPVIVGDTSKISNWIEENYRDGAFDGVKYFPPFQRAPFHQFVDHVVPELQRRGLTRSSYDTSTLREHIGFSAPAPTTREVSLSTPDPDAHTASLDLGHRASSAVAGR